MSRLLGTDEVKKKVEYITYPQEVRSSDAGVAAAVVTMDRYSDYRSNVVAGQTSKSQSQKLSLSGSVGD